MEPKIEDRGRPSIQGGDYQTFASEEESRGIDHPGGEPQVRGHSPRGRVQDHLKGEFEWRVVDNLPSSLQKNGLWYVSTVT